MPEIDDTQTMRPPGFKPWLSSKAVLRCNGASRLTASTLRQAVSVILAMVLSRVIPALCTTTSKAPCWLTWACNCAAASTAVISSGSAEPPTLAAACCNDASAWGTSTHTTWAPSRASTWAMARPMPREAPVTSARRPAKGLSQLTATAPSTGGSRRTTCPDT